MGGAVMIRHETVFGFDQDMAGLVDQHGAERMIAMADRAACHRERAAQEMRVTLRCAQFRMAVHWRSLRTSRSGFCRRLGADFRGQLSIFIDSTASTSSLWLSEPYMKGLSRSPIRNSAKP